MNFCISVVLICLCLSRVAFCDFPSNQELFFERLGGGANYVYQVSSSEQKFVLKIPKNRASIQTNTPPEEEYHNSQWAFLLGLGARVRFFDNKSGMFVFDFIENQGTLSKEDLQKKEVLEKTVLLLRDLHFSEGRFASDVDVFDQIESFYQFVIKNSAMPLPLDLEDSMNCVRTYRPILKALNIEKLPCHNDPNLGNFLKTDSGLKLIDWECACNNDPAWDLAFLSCQAGFSNSQEEQMLRVYTEHSPIEIQACYLLPARLVIYKALVQLWRFLWLHIQIINKNDAYDLEEYLRRVDERYTSHKMIRESSEFKEALSTLETAPL